MSIFSNDLIITSTQRLTVELQNQYQIIQRKDNKANIWPEKKIYPLSVWLQRCWQENVTTQYLPPLIAMNEWQTRWALQNFLKNHSRLNSWQLSDVAKQCYDAMWSCAYWNISVTSQDFMYDETNAEYFQWQKKFLKQCTELQLLPFMEILPTLTNALSKENFLNFRSMIFIGFDMPPPALQSLADVLRQHQLKVEFYTPVTNCQTQQQFCFENIESEIEAMAQWAFNQHKKNPQAKIVCAFPELTHKKHMIYNCFKKISGSHSFLDESLSLVNIAAEKTLINFPAIKTAFLILQSQQLNNSKQEWIQLFRGQFFKISSEEQFNHFSWSLEQLQMNIVDAKTIVKIANSMQINTLERYIKKLPTTLVQNIAKWVQDFQLLLEYWQWPGNKNLSDEQWQAITAFVNFLHELAKQNNIFNDLSYNDFLSLLSDRLNEIPFTASIKNSAPIQIMGLLETAGMQCDYLWLGNMRQAEWPRPLQDLRLLPNHLKKQLPHCNREQQWQFSHDVCKRLGKSTKHLFVSYSAFDNDEKHQPCVFFKNIPEHLTTELNSDITQTPLMICFNTQKTILHPDLAVPLNQSLIQGGTYTLKLQALCPFRAFTEIRLQAKKPEALIPSFSAKERGLLTHSILQSLWQNIKTQSHLKDLPDLKRSRLLKNLISKKLSDLLQQKLMTINSVMLDVEKERLHTLLLNWLSFEDMRRDFTVIATEQRHHVMLGPIELNVSIDRIDAIDGKYWLIDYKTGQTNINDWLGLVPLEPQLPLYAITYHNPIEAILFAEIRTEGFRLQGIVNENIWMQTLKKERTQYHMPWNNQFQQWQDALLSLANELSQGDACVAPRHIQACQYCHLQRVCRIAEPINDKMEIENENH